MLLAHENISLGGVHGTTSLESEKAIMKVVPLGKISESSEMMSSLTWMSWLSKIFILISPASLDKESYTVKFKFFSRASLFHSIFLFGPLLLAILASAINGNHLQILSKSWVFTYETYNTVDFVSVFMMSLILPFSFVSPFFIAIGIPSIPSLALARDLTWPKNGGWSILGTILLLTAEVFGKMVLNLISTLVSNIQVFPVYSFR